jgi:hypothetical protein
LHSGLAKPKLHFIAAIKLHTWGIQMNMREPTTAWDRNPTDAELERFYGKDKPTEVRDEYFEVLTQTVRKVPVKNLSLDYTKTTYDRENDLYGTQLDKYPVTEVIEDYLGYDKPLLALFEAFEKSDCPFVAKFREALAESFADHNADEVEELRRTE